MSDKELVIEAVRSLPDEVTMEEIVEEVEILAAIQRGIKDAEEGRVVTHEEAKRRFNEWLTRSSGPTPRSQTSKQSSTT